MKKTCTVCSEEIESDAIFCSWCGEWQSPVGWHMKAGNPLRSHSPLGAVAASYTSSSEFKNVQLEGKGPAEWLLIEGDVALIGSGSRLAAWSISSIWNASASPQSPLWLRSGAYEWAAILRPYLCVGRERRVELIEISTGTALAEAIDCSWDLPDPLAIERYSRDLGRFALLILPTTFGLAILKLTEDLNGVTKQEVNLPRDAGPVVGLQMDDEEMVWVCTRSGFLAGAPLTDFWGAEVDPHWERLPLEQPADARIVCFSMTGEGACLAGQLPSGQCFVQIARAGSVISLTPQTAFNAVPQWPLVVDPDRPAVILTDRRRDQWCVVDWGKQNVQMVHWTDQEFNAPDLSQCVTVPRTGPLVLLNSTAVEHDLGQYARLEVDTAHLKPRGIRIIPISRRETLAAASGSLVMNVDGDTAYMIRGGAQASGKGGHSGAPFSW